MPSLEKLPIPIRQPIYVYIRTPIIHLELTSGEMCVEHKCTSHVCKLHNMYNPHLT